MSGKPPKLRPGKGAKATIITRLIKPKPPLPGGDPKSKHRSDIVVLGHFNDEKGRLCFTFRYADAEADDSETANMYAIRRFVKIVEEGPPEDLFDGEQISWEESHARKLLYCDLSDGTVPLEGGDTDEIYAMRPDYAKYDKSMFPERLESLRDIVRKAKKRKHDDKKAFEAFKTNPKNQVSHQTYAGLPQWKSSKSRRCALIDLKNGVLESMGFKEMYKLHPETMEEFPFEYWKERVKQEIGTAKYLHTLKINNGKKLILSD